MFNYEVFFIMLKFSTTPLLLIFSTVTHSCQSQTILQDLNLLYIVSDRVINGFYDTFGKYKITILHV